MERNAADYRVEHRVDDEERGEGYVSRHRHFEKVNFQVSHDPGFRLDIRRSESGLEAAARDLGVSARESLVGRMADAPVGHREHFRDELSVDHSRGNLVVGAALEVLDSQFRLELLGCLNGSLEGYNSGDIERLKEALDLVADLGSLNSQGEVRPGALSWSPGEASRDFELAGSELLDRGLDFIAHASKANFDSLNWRGIYRTDYPAGVVLDAAEHSLQLEVASLRLKGAEVSAINRSLMCQDLVSDIRGRMDTCEVQDDLRMERFKDDWNSDWSPAQAGERVLGFCERLRDENSELGWQLLNAVREVDPDVPESRINVFRAGEARHGMSWLRESGGAASEKIFGEFGDHFRPADYYQAAVTVSKGMSHGLGERIDAFGENVRDMGRTVYGFQPEASILKDIVMRETHGLGESLFSQDLGAYRGAVSGLKDVLSDLDHLRESGSRGCEFISEVSFRGENPVLAEQLIGATMENHGNEKPSWLYQDAPEQKTVFDSFRDVNSPMSEAYRLEAARDLAGALSYRVLEEALSGEGSGPDARFLYEMGVALREELGRSLVEGSYVRYQDAMGRLVGLGSQAGGS